MRMSRFFLDPPLVWVSMYKTRFPKFFKLVKPVKENSITAVRLKADVEELTADSIGEFAVSFLQTKPEVFTLSETFLLRTNHNEVALQEDVVTQHLYNDPTFYSSVGMEFCSLFDIMYAKTGTEAVAEPFYRVVEKQEMCGNQSLKVLSQRAKVDWCLPFATQCEKALCKMADMYIQRNARYSIKRHYIPIYSSEKAKRKHLEEASKVITRITSSEPKLPFLL